MSTKLEGEELQRLCNDLLDELKNWELRWREASGSAEVSETEARRTLMAAQVRRLAEFLEALDPGHKPHVLFELVGGLIGLNSGTANKYLIPKRMTGRSPDSPEKKRRKGEIIAAMHYLRKAEYSEDKAAKHVEATAHEKGIFDITCHQAKVWFRELQPLSEDIVTETVENIAQMRYEAVLVTVDNDERFRSTDYERKAECVLKEFLK